MVEQGKSGSDTLVAGFVLQNAKNAGELDSCSRRGAGFQSSDVEAEIIFVGKGVVTTWLMPCCRQSRLIELSKQHRPSVELATVTSAEWL